MDIADVKERLVEIESEIAGIKRSYVHAPHSLPESDLPCFMNFARPAVHNQESLGDGINAEAREFILRLYVLPISSGVSEEAESRVEPFISLTVTALLQHPGLTSSASPSPLAGVSKTRLLSDTGVSVLRFSGGGVVQEYLGVEFRISVESQQHFTYEEFE